MNSPSSYLLILFAVIAFAGNLSAQADDICGEFGFMPSLDGPRLSAPYIYGRINVTGLDPGAKFPKISVTYSNRGQSPNRLTIGKSGNYCFRITSGSGGTLVIDMDGVEVTQRQVASFGTAQQREDFELDVGHPQRSSPSRVISSKFVHPPNKKTVEIYKNAAEAEKSKDLAKAVEFMKQVVSIDPADFIGWAYLGTLYFERNSLSEAESAFRKSLELKVEYPTPWVNMGKIRVAQKQLEAAIEIFKHAAMLDPTSARTFRLLGETYLQLKQGTLGVQALNHAIRLDPIGMAECHLQLAHLYQLAGAKQMAAKEYKMFLTKVPEHPEKKKFENYIENNQ
ncbi:MAG: tetratricopeptide repeat protein [Blastocatellia bacterium]